MRQWRIRRITEEVEGKEPGPAEPEAEAPLDGALAPPARASGSRHALGQARAAAVKREREEAAANEVAGVIEPMED